MIKKYFHITAKEVPIFKGKLVIVLTNDVDNVKKYLPNWEDDYVYGHTWKYSYKNRQGYYLILNLWNTDMEITHGVIAHEAVHVAQFVTERAGIRDDECTAYITEWATDQVYRYLDKMSMTKLLSIKGKL